MPRDRWAAALDCGHEAPTPPLGLPPRVGSYLSCPARCPGGPKRVTAVRAVPPVYVQEAMW